MRFAIIMALGCALSATGAAGADTAWTPADAIDRFDEDPARAAAVLRPLAETDDGAAFHLMMLLHDWLPRTADNTAALRTLAAATVERIADRSGGNEPPPAVDVATMREFAAVLRYVGHRAESPAGLWPVVPCRTLRRNPGYVDLETQPTDAPAGFLLETDCADATLPPVAEAYFDRLAERLDAVATPYSGTNARYFARLERLHRLLIRVVPQRLLTLPGDPGHDPRPTHRPLETWSMLSLANRRRFDTYAALYEPALPALAAHYRRQFAMTADDAPAAARIALLLPAYEGHWAAPDRHGLRWMILEGVPAAEIAGTIDAAPSAAEMPMTLLAMASYGGAWSYTGIPDPLISVSVHRPAVLRLLLDRGPFAPPYLDELRRGDQTVDPNARTWIGKTPLMTAAEIDNPESVRILLDAGADPNAALDAPALRHDRRTALMYAAANASGPVIEALLAAGADPAAEDALGFAAIDYLNGRGPTGANPLLTAAQIETLSTRLPASSRSADRRSALMLAAATAEPWEIDAFLEAGADPALSDADGLTALDHLMRRHPDDGSPTLWPDERSRLISRLTPQ